MNKIEINDFLDEIATRKKEYEYRDIEYVVSEVNKMTGLNISAYKLFCNYIQENGNEDILAYKLNRKIKEMIKQISVCGGS
ncbi:hypothetical protein [Flavobacterium filum]|uniref:hypothetical protein n=1 Tax=Flavobacterium filum TaxID=370974 RepID=UPI0023F1706B|nr:hypothetical protein [Flavobacterium filum]